MSKYIEVNSACGRVWHVPLENVRLDMACFYMEADGITLPEAKKQAARLTEGDLETWFAEQFVWGEVVRYGELKKDLTSKQLIALGRKMADQIRGGNQEETAITANSWALKGNAV